MKAAVVILNYNGLNFLKQFLNTIIQQCPQDAEVIVADNNSSDESVAWLRENYSQVKIIHHPVNYGFAGGYNKALMQIDAKYFVILNSDIEVTQGWLAPLVDFMEQHPDVAASHPKIRSFHNKEYFEYAGAGGGFIDVFGFPFCRGRIFSTLEKDTGQYDDATSVFWATGACMIVRSDCFWQAGGFDEFFFAHMEEIDLCWRLQRMNYKIMYLPFSKVFHIGGGTLPKNSPRKTFLNYRNNLSMLAKNLPAVLLLPVFLFRLIADIAASAVFLVQSGLPHFASVWKAYFSFLANLGSIIRSRRKFSKTYSFKLPSTMYRGSVLLAYFVAGKKKFSQLKRKM
jgi:GT2 family glycosyltransferase